MFTFFLFTVINFLHAGYKPVEHNFTNKAGVEFTLLIRPIQDGDRVYLDETYGSERAMKTYLDGTVRSKEEIDRRFACYTEWSRTSDQHPWSHFLVFLGEIKEGTALTKGQFLGGVMVEPDGKQAEISYVFVPKSWGNGIYTAAVFRILEITLPRLKTYQIERLEATARHDNIGSRRVLEKNGFLKDEKDTQIRSAELKDGEANQAARRLLYFLPIQA